MQVQFTDEGERLVAHPEGRMEATDASDFAAAVEQRLQPGTHGLSIDLATLDFISLGAIRGLLRLGRTLSSDQREMEFRHGDAHVRHALDQAGMGEFFRFTPTLHTHRGHHHEAS